MVWPLRAVLNDGDVPELKTPRFIGPKAGVGCEQNVIVKLFRFQFRSVDPSRHRRGFTSRNPLDTVVGMKRRDFLEKWGLSSLKVKVGFLEAEFDPRDPDRAAAWDLYVELLTRVTTQIFQRKLGTQKAALDSVYAIFPLTREILRRHGSGCGEFAKLAIPILNQVIRPFTAKLHRLSLAAAYR